MSSDASTVFAGRFRVIRRLGAGGTAAVFLTCDERLGREVALKRLHGAEVTAETAQRLQREARIMASLRHPNLVTVYDMLTDEDDLLLAMEYVRGETLADVLVSAPLPWQRTLELLEPVAAALDYVHANGVIHRDVKPSNVLVGTSGVVKVTDLDLATAAEITRITPPGAILGTPAYMAPEQARAATCTGAVDIYALATIAFQALTGRLPRAGSTIIAVLAQATRQPPPDLRAHRPDTPVAAAEALMRGMSADPEARQESAAGLLDELRTAFRSGELRAPSRPAAGPMRDQDRQRDAPSGPAAATSRAHDRQRDVPSRPAAAPARAHDRQRNVPSLAATAPTPPRVYSRHPNVRARALALAALAVGVVAVLVVVLASGKGGGGTKAASSGGSTATDTPAATSIASPAASPSAASAATPSAAPASAAPRPLSATATVRAFYRRAAAGDYGGAWRLAGPGMRAAFGDSLVRFRSEMSSLRRIEFRRLAVAQRDDGSVTVAIESIATHADRVDHCSGTLRTVRGPGGRWVVEPAGVSCTRG